VIDVLVAGAGPSGLAAAIAAASAGLEVVVVDPQPGTIDKACGEGLMPAVQDALGGLGVHPDGRPFVGIRYLRGDVVAEGRFARPGLGVRRTTLHAALADRAAALGVRREVGRVAGIRQDDDAVEAGGLRARWLIAADGMRSSIRRELDLDARAPARPRYGVRRHFAVEPWSDTVDVHWADDAEAYVTPVGDRLVGIALLYGDAARDADRGRSGRPFDRLLARFPELAARAVDPADEARGVGPFETRSRRRVAGRVLLVGDAAGYVDAITGEGTKLGVLGALAAVEALRAGHPQRWEADWRRMWRTYWATTEGLLALTRRPTLRAALPRVLRAAPWVFDRALGVLAAA
jgi:flavin-dependent dehydrogenase